ncbi:MULTISPECIES: phage holin [Geobacillus]|uniref:phage holin n=1 Tax=Geobacillus TaxID=129337 RepID=UPI0009BF84F7|nr:MULTISPECIES: phage holin [Geobacillus]MED3732570.1 phage holin [Geobacillus stearothermophilus]MED3740098.1 phage holin [Geobacillus stearothermophilus]MED3765953.1 phage holin [Geobacillus stearothermophilus]MED3773746.1 phage holin [Geobacillus stearothermophilus]OQP12612.1 phage holin [Geobacillus thermoleovorans]
MDKASVTRFALLIVAVVNAVLNMTGYQTIPDDLVNNVIAVASGLYALYMGWKNNYLSKKGRKQKKVLEKHGLL